MPDRRSTRDLDSLGRELRGKLWRPGEDSYRRATEPRNASANQHPLAVAEVAGAEDIAATLAFAVREELTVVVQATGHGAAGEVGKDSLLIDTSRLLEVELDSDRRLVRAGSGVTWEALNEATWTRRLLAPTGTAPDVGVAGYTFGGGVGWLTRPHGLASASLVAVDLVDGDGNVRRADPGSDTEALWAFRGGGPVGIATAVELEVHPADNLWSGFVLWPVEHLAEVAKYWADAVPSFDRSLSTVISTLHVPDAPDAPGDLGGGVAVYLGAATIAGEAAATQLTDLLDELPSPAISTLGACDAKRLSSIHLDPPSATPAVAEGRWLGAGAAARAAEILTGAGATQGDSAIAELELRHVAVSEHPDPGSGAMVEPPGDFLLHAVGPAPDQEARERVEGALDEIRELASPVDTGRTATSFRDGRTSAPDALPPAAASRLESIRSTYDPGGLIRRPR